MDFATLIFIALGLSMDAFAVSMSNGLCYANIGRKEIFKTAAAFGLFQGIMPVLGYMAGRLFDKAITALDHWIALILLSGIGIKMIVDAARERRHPENVCRAKALSNKLIIMQAVATSIDALAVGVSLAIMQLDIISSAAIICATTFVCCLAGAYLGKRFGGALKGKAQIAGGIILIAIGIKIFIEHMFG